MSCVGLGPKEDLSRSMLMLQRKEQEREVSRKRQGKRIRGDERGGKRRANLRGQSLTRLQQLSNLGQGRRTGMNWTDSLERKQRSLASSLIGMETLSCSLQPEPQALRKKRKIKRLSENSTQSVRSARAVRIAKEVSSEPEQLRKAIVELSRVSRAFRESYQELLAKTTFEAEKEEIKTRYELEAVMIHQQVRRLKGFIEQMKIEIEPSIASTPSIIKHALPPQKNSAGSWSNFKEKRGGVAQTSRLHRRRDLACQDGGASSGGSQKES